MKIQEKKELTQKDILVLIKELADVQRKLIDIQFDLQTKKLKNHQLIKKTKKHIAILKTLIRQKIARGLNDQKA